MKKQFFWKISNRYYSSLLRAEHDFPVQLSEQFLLFYSFYSFTLRIVFFQEPS